MSIARMVPPVAKRIVAGLCALIWSVCGYVGYGLVSHLSRRGVPGYPNVAQWEWYVILPALMTLTCLGALVFSEKTPTPAYVAIVVVELVAVFPFLLFSGGGI